MIFNTSKTTMKKPSYKAVMAFALMSFFISACSTQKSSDIAIDTDGKSAQQLLNDARFSLRSNNYEEAIRRYESLEAKYPLGLYAQQALLEQAYAYYKYDEPDTSLDTLDRYSRIYPNSKRMDYALYLRGLVNFNRGGSIIDKVFPRTFTDLDSARQKEAFRDFSTLIENHPSSPYVADARTRMHYLKNTLGTTEVNVAKYYLTRGAYLAAFNRADYAIKYHQGTPAVVEALQIKTCAARKLGKDSLADDSLRMLKHNFPKQSNFKCAK